MNKFPTWRYFVIIAVLMLGILYALPNLYPAQPAIQVAYTDSSKSADQSLLEIIREEIAKQDIEISEINLFILSTSFRIFCNNKILLSDSVLLSNSNSLELFKLAKGFFNS